MASKNIRGITIKINGDATELDKALREVDGELKTTQSDLRAVDRALKLDPTNVVLLEQKQKLLAEAAKDSKKKHDMLAEALDQTKRSGTATAEQIDALTRETEQAAVATQQAAESAKKFSPALAEVSARAGEVADKMRGVSAAGAAVVAGLGAMAVKAAEAADDINEFAQKTGFSVEFVQEMEFASERVDVSIDSIRGAFTKLKKNLDSDSASVSDAFRAIGVNVKQLENSGASMDEIFMEVVAALGNVDNELERDQLAMQIFGKSADDLAGILDDGGEALRMYGQEAEDMGLILDGDALNGANAFADAMDKMKAIAEQSVLVAGAALVEKLLPAIEWFLNVASKVLAFLAKLPSEVLIVMGVVAALVALIAPIAELIRNITGAINGVREVGEAFNSGAGSSVFATFAKWAGIIVIVVAAITALIAAIGALTGKSEDINSAFEGLTDATTGQVGQITKLSNVRGYATGGVFEPNAPLIIGVGDNRAEREVLAPRSELVSAYGEAMQRYGGAGGGNVNVSISFDGDLAQVGRVLEPAVTASAQRRGKVV